MMLDPKNNKEAEIGALCDPRHREAGMALLMVLFLMIFLSVIGMSVTTSSVSESQMSTNFLDQDTAFQSAETALRAGESWIAAFGPNPVPLPVPNCAAPCIAQIGSLPNPPWGTPQAASLPPGEVSGLPGVPGANTAPEYTIEFAANVVMQGSSLGLSTGQPQPTVNFYQITARGTGRTNQAQAVLQSMFAW